MECWHNGAIIHTIPTTGNLHLTVQQSRDHLKVWTGQEPVLSPTLAAKLREIDALITRMAFAKEYQ